MSDKNDKSRNPSARTLSRWETEGGATKNRRLKRPRDPIALAKLIGNIAIGQIPDAVDDDKDLAAVACGRAGGLKGGRARAKKRSAKARSAPARKAVRARWSRSS